MNTPYSDPQNPMPQPQPPGPASPAPGPDTPVPAYPDQATPGYSQASYGEARMPRGNYPQPTSSGPVDPNAAGYAATGYSVRSGGVAVAPKSPGLALVASFFIPGLGSMINGEVGKGIGILFGYFVSLLLTIVIIGIVGVIGFWIYGMVDAYNGAKLWNARHGIYS
jgi:TM2 domain-containing membrane protein YozV